MATLLVCILLIANCVLSWCSLDPRFEGLEATESTTPTSQQAEAVEGLLRRLVGERASEFEVVVEEHFGPSERDTYRLESDEEKKKIRVKGNSGVAAALGVHNYLKQWAGCHLSWSGSQLKLPQPLPSIDEPVQVTTNDRFRYYQNVCTVSYSSVWWNWTRWQWEIDWMALNGINLPLSFTGQEALWRRVYHKFNFTRDDLDEFFSGPAFLAWQRMGNLDGWGGPLGEKWQDQQLALQHQIIDRMRSFGMTPVLPAFSGHVPRAITRLYPHVNVTKLNAWGRFNATYCCTLLLNPEEDLFKKIGNAFISELINEFGTDHIYNCDVFNEMNPLSGDLSYLRQIGEAVLEGMTGADPRAVWLMQGWLFNNPFWSVPGRAKALLTSVPLGRMLVLDLQAELTPWYVKLESFYGQPFIWCMLHNFGGVLGMYGMVSSINVRAFDARKFENSTMIGTGLTMEGIEQNDVMYELMNEMAWRFEPVDLEDWFRDYAWRRYGTKQDKAGTAWIRLMKTVYNCTIPGYKQHGGYVVVKRPNLKLSPPLWYPVDDVLQSWDDLLSLTNELNGSVTYRYDLVDVTREVLQSLANQFYTATVDGFKTKNKTLLTYGSSKVIEIMEDLEIILSSDSHYLLGRWLEAAKASGKAADQQELFEYNARNQITLWGPEGNIRDYAAKQWGGLMKDYYIPRWKLFQQMLLTSVSLTKPFNQNVFNQRAFHEIEEPFTFKKSSFPINPVGDTIEIATKLQSKWKNVADDTILTATRKKFELQMTKKNFGKRVKRHLSYIF